MGSPSCDGDTAVEPVQSWTLGVYLTDFFQGEKVCVDVDGRTVLEDTVVSNGVVLVSAAVIDTVAQGTHTVGVTVNDSVTRDSSFGVVGPLYVLVRYRGDTLQPFAAGQIPPASAKHQAAPGGMQPTCFRESSALPSVSCLDVPVMYSTPWAALCHQLIAPVSSR